MPKLRIEEPLIFILVIFCISIIMIVRINASNQNTYIKALTLKEAYNISLKEAINWDTRAELYSITSTDIPDKEERSYGLDGKRSFWNLDFSIPNTKDHYIISIQNGQVVSKTKTKGLNKIEKLMNTEEILLDSPKVLNNAVNMFKIKTGTSWAKGYHFELNKNDRIPMIGVVGWDQEGNFTKIYYNAKTGELIDGYHKISVGGGFYSSSSAMPIRGYTSPNIQGADVYKEDSGYRAFIIWGFTSSNTQFIKISRDDGLNWNDIHLENNILQLWFSKSFAEDKKLFALTENKLFTSYDYGENWNCSFSSSSIIFDIDTNGDKIIILTEKGLHISDDGGYTWANYNAPKDVIFVAISSDNTVFVSSNRVVYKKINEKFENINIVVNDDILDLIIFKNILCCYTSTTIGLINNKNWELVDIPEGINNVTFNSDFDSNRQLYVCCKNGNLQKIHKEGDSNWANEIIQIPKEGHLTELIVTAEELYFCMQSNLVWEKM